MAAMATTMSNTFAILPLKAISSHNNFPLFFPTNSCSTTSLTKFAFQWNSTQPASSAATIRNKNNFLCSSVDTSNQCVTVIDNDDDDCKDCESEALDLEFENEIQLYSFNPLPIFLLAALPGGIYLFLYFCYDELWQKSLLISQYYLNKLILMEYCLFLLNFNGVIE